MALVIQVPTVVGLECGGDLSGAHTTRIAQRLEADAVEETSAQGNTLVGSASMVGSL